MKEYLIDVPVKINIWTRPECQKKQWDVIRKVRPSTLFIQSDGGRNEEEWEKINQNREMIDRSIDWDCKVFRLYEKENLGMYAMGQKTNALIWSNVDRCIFTEDDQIPSASFFEFCKELLEKYKDDMRIECICGMNYQGISEQVTADYFFCKHGSIWGVATWRNRFEERKEGFSFSEDSYVMSLLKKKTKSDRAMWKTLSGYAHNSTYDGHVAWDEFWFGFDVFAQERVRIIPKYNMISNIGCDEDSAHSAEYEYLPHTTRRLFNMKLYEMTFPLKHPKYVISDDEYMKKFDYVLGYNHPVISLIRKVESRFNRLRLGGIRAFLKFKRIKMEK